MLEVHVYGDRNKRYELEVSNDGTVDIEFIGPIRVGGMSFIEAKKQLISKLKHHFKMSSFKIIISKYSSIQVTLIGDVKYPGIYNLSSFSTAKDLLIESKGVRENASVREIEIKRNGKTIAKLDFYDLLFKGKAVGTTLLKHGDIVVIKQAKTLVSIDGFVNHAAIFELDDSETLKTLIKYAGGMKADASSRHILGSKRFFLPETYFEYGLIKRYSSTLNYETKSFDLGKVIKGEESIALHPQDEIFIFSQNDLRSSKYITTKGDILIQKGKLRYFEGMTLRDAVHGAGVDGILDDLVRVTTINTPDRMPKTTFYSFKKDADAVLSPYDEVEIVRYFIDEKSNRKKKILNLDLRELNESEYILEPYDEVTIYKIPNWGEKRVITLKGEVKFPGKYTVSNGERLSSVIERAGGFTEEAFIEGSVFTRDSIRKRQIRNYNQSLARIKRELAIYNAMPANAKSSIASSSASNTLNEVILEAQKYQPVGRVSIKLKYNLKEFKGSEYDLVLKDLDELVIPNQIDTVTVFGEVFNPTSFVYSSEFDADEYLEMASGLSRSADAGSIYIIHANGTSELVDAGWFSGDVEIQKGDTIVVPLYIKEYNTLEVWNSVARVLSSFAVTAAALTTLGVI